MRGKKNAAENNWGGISKGSVEPVDKEGPRGKKEAKKRSYILKGIETHHHGKT